MPRSIKKGPRPVGCGFEYSWRWAARTPSSCSTMPTRRRRRGSRAGGIRAHRPSVRSDLACVRHPRGRGVFTAALVRLADGYVPGNGLDRARAGAVVSEAQFAQDADAARGAVTGGAAHRDARRRLRRGSSCRRPCWPAWRRTTQRDRGGVQPRGCRAGVADLEVGLAPVNASRCGLTAGICTDSLALATDFAAHAQAGVVKVNCPTSGLDLNVPFGGVKDSSTNTFREPGHRGGVLHAGEDGVSAGVRASRVSPARRCSGSSYRLRSRRAPRSDLELRCRKPVTFECREAALFERGCCGTTPHRTPPHGGQDPSTDTVHADGIRASATRPRGAGRDASKNRDSPRARARGGARIPTSLNAFVQSARAHASMAFDAHTESKKKEFLK